MSDLQDRPPVIRWTWRVLVHAVDGKAWIGSLVTFLLGVMWLVQSELHPNLPANVNHALADFIGYWSGPASLLLLIGVLMQAASRAGMDEQRDGSALSPKHVDDLHAQSRVFHQRLFQPYYNVTLNLSGVAVRNFCQHFSDVATHLREWNGEAERWQAAMRALATRTTRETQKPIDGRDLQINSLMQAVAIGTYSSPLDVIWGVQTPVPGGVRNLYFHDPNTQQDIPVWTIPDDADPFEFATAVQSRLIEAREWPEATKLREIQKRLDELRPSLSLELDEIQLDHAPDGHCDTCRPPKEKR